MRFDTPISAQVFAIMAVSASTAQAAKIEMREVLENCVSGPVYPS